jgi:hypothetical protein
MALTPSRSRSRSSRAKQIARNLAVADAVYALLGSWSGSGHRGRGRSGPGRGTLLLAGAGVAAAAVAGFLGRGKLARLLPGRSDDEAASSAPGPPQPSNYDSPGPPANTATPMPAPDPVTRAAAGDGAPTRPAIDERAEEEAAAAEAAAIGGTQSDYAGISGDEPADEAERPVVEAGGGEAEGQEQAEAELAENATVRDQAPSDAERQIEDAIEAQDEPASGERPEGLAPLDADRPPGAEADVVTGAESEGGGISGRPGARLDDAAETPGLPATGSPATEPQTGDEPGEGDEPQTWSGRPA